ncbi:hypothetical protein GCM10022234_30580 [Aeromicrobium panaciterrae]|uniref:hypothetical protein n=1 Tax=Aeromicrobium panaciterrae TaxID=363861 RepID=UPI0031D09DE6
MTIEDSAKTTKPAKGVVKRGVVAVQVEANEEEGLLIDQLGERLESLQLLRGRGDESSTNQLLEAFGSSGVIEDQMLKELSSKEPLRHTERFDEAHRQAMRALEVFDRNGSRPPSALTKVPPLIKPVAERIVQLLITFIVRSHQKRLVKQLRQLYALREANSPVGSDDYQLLATARIQVDAITPDLNKSSLPLPAFLVGGAAISGTLSVLGKSLTTDAGRFAFAAGFLVVGLGLFWCVLKAAGIARSRARIALDGSFKALYEVIGDAGNPPKDQAKLFAVIASILLLAIWIVVPSIIGFQAIKTAL